MAKIHHSQRVLSLFLIILLLGFPQLSETIYTPSLPNIATALHTTSALMQWTLSVYFVGFAFGVLFWGQISDRIGRRPCMIFGIVCYAVGSLLCALSASIYMLLAMRLLQAFGASVGSIVTQTMMRESYSAKQRHHAFAVTGIALSSVSAIGPLIGGYINHWFYWQANFITLVIIGILLVILTIIRLPETKPTHLHISHFRETVNIAWRLLRDPYVLGCAWIVAGINGILFGFYAEAPFIFIRLLKFNAANYGKVGLFIGVASVLGSLTTKRLLNRGWCVRKTVKMGCLITIISSIALVLLSYFILPYHHPVLAMLTIMLPYAGIIFGSIGLILPGILTHALNKYQDCLGTAGAFFGLIYYVLIACLVWFMGILHNGTIYPMPAYFLVLTVTIALVAVRSLRSR